MQLVDSGGKMCRKCFSDYDRCTKLISTLRKSLAKIGDFIDRDSSSDSEGTAEMQPPALKRVATCVGLTSASPDVTVKNI